MSKIIKFSEEQIWSYINCPVQFEMSQRNIVPVIPQTLKYYINQVTKMFFTNLMEGTILDMQDLKKEWDKIWKKNSGFIDSKKGIQGYAALNLLYKWAEKVQLRILDVMVPYSLLFPNKNNDIVFEVKGEIPCISVNKANQPVILVMDFNDRHTDQVRVDMNLKYTLECMALKQQMGRNVGIHVRNVKYSTDTFSYRSELDYERLKTTVTAVGFCIMNNLYYPREGPNCSSCKVMGACHSWTGMIERSDEPWLKLKNT